MTDLVVLRTASDVETEALGARLGRVIIPGARILMDGPVGAGKTTLVRGLVGALPSAGAVRVKSPTYALCHAYPTTPRCWHADLYRLGGSADVWTLGLFDPVLPEDVLLLEWSDRAPGLFDDALLVHAAAPTEHERVYTLESTGPVSAAMIAALRAGGAQ